MPYLETIFPEIKRLDFEEQYSYVINKIGIDNLIEVLCWSKEELQQAYRKDKNFNSISLVKWDNLSNSPCFLSLLRSNSIVGLPLSQRVCILKETARLYVLGER